MVLHHQATAFCMSTHGLQPASWFRSDAGWWSCLDISRWYPKFSHTSTRQSIPLFELQLVNICSPSRDFILANIYRPPSASKSTFLEFANLLTTLGINRDVRPQGLASASRPKNLATASASWVLASASASWVMASASWVLASSLKASRGQPKRNGM